MFSPDRFSIFKYVVGMTQITHLLAIVCVFVCQHLNNLNRDAQKGPWQINSQQMMPLKSTAHTQAGTTPADSLS